MSTGKPGTTYKTEAVREQLVDTFRKRRGEATVSDLVAVTGLPLHQVSAELPAVADEYGARLKVTESGEVLYSFPATMKSRYRGFGPSFKRFRKAFVKGAAAVGKAVFKGWIVVMLVGYFVFFILLALLALLASIAASTAGSSDSRSSRRGGGLGGFWLATRLLDTIARIWFYSELFKSPQERAREAQMRDARRSAQPKRPLHKAIFSYVFGDGDPDAGWDALEKKAVVAYLQANRGLMTMEEFITLTGRDPQDASTAINRYLLEFGGEPEVSAAGTIYYRFEDILRRKDTVDRSYGSTIPLKRMAAFSSNTPKADRSFRLINLVNLVFGGYFLYGALSVGQGWFIETAKGFSVRGGFEFLYSFTAYLFAAFLDVLNPAALIGWVLGVAPLAFSVLFFLIPALRSLKVKARNEGARLQNLRKVIYRAIWDKPLGFKAEQVPAGGTEVTPQNPQAAAQKLVGEAAAWSKAEPAADGSFDFETFRQAKEDIRDTRSTVDTSRFDLGDTVFDSHA